MDITSNSAPLPASVLVALGTSGSYAALDHAAEEALRRHTRLHLLHAVRSEDPEDQAAGELRLAAAVRHALSRVGGQVPVHDELAVADPLTAVTRASAHAALVVVGRRALVRAAHPYVRSVAGGAGSRLNTPVVTVPDDWTEARSGGPVVVGVDEPSRSGDVLAAGLEAARARRVPLRVLACWWRPLGAGRTALTQVADQTAPHRLREEVYGALSPLLPAYSDLSVTVEVRNERPGDALVAASRDASLLVLGRHTTAVAAASHLGPVARAVVRESTCPVLLSAPSDHHRIAPHRVGEPALI